MSPQSSIAHYRFTGKLGEGGMGEVWRAIDTKLNRDVGIKILPDAFANDPDRMARFAREAQVLASLNHPNIAAIYGVEERALVMELAEGDTLNGPLSEKQALPIIEQLIDALEYAHDKGIIHRDLKPANIKITPEGRVKVLDFGLAKAVENSPAKAHSSPTLTMGPVVMGTPGYMAPEQARGETVDKRADIWAFGALLYETLTGERPLDQPDWERVPYRFRRLLRRCLERDPRRRLRDIGDARDLLVEMEVQAPVRRSVAPWVVAAAVLAVVAAVGWWIAWRATRPVEHPLTRLDLDLGPDAVTGLNLTVAISPDGRRIVFPMRGPDGKQVLATRLLDQSRPILLLGTESGRDPFFSPDGQWIGFAAGNELKKISVHGGAAVTLASSGVYWLGAGWGEDGSILATDSLTGPLLRIPAAGGAPKTLTRLGAGEITHRWPQVLPGISAVLFTASPSAIGMRSANLESVSLKTGQVKTFLRGGNYGRYLPSGHLVYVHQGVLFGVKFDPQRLEVRDPPVPLLEDVASNPTTGGGQFDFSATGTFVYATGKGAAQTWQTAWLDSSGKMQPLMAPGAYVVPRLSPDGRKLAFIANGDVYIRDLERDTTTRLTFTGVSAVPVWAHDNKHVVVGSGSSIYWMRSDGSGDPQPLLETPSTPLTWSLSPNGQQLAYFDRDSETGFDIWTLPLDLTDPDHPKPGKPESFLRTSANELLPRFSADGRWIAYRSDESGTNEIYVRPFPKANGGKWQISTGGGLYAFWSNNGGELFYETADNRIMVVDYNVDGASFAPGRPRLWADKQLFYTGNSNLDLAPDGKRFVVLTMPESAGGEKRSVHVTMLLNFFDEVKRRIP